MVLGIYPAFPGNVSWLANNLAGGYKRATGMAIHIGVGNLAGGMSYNRLRSYRVILKRQSLTDRSNGLELLPTAGPPKILSWTFPGTWLRRRRSHCCRRDALVVPANQPSPRTNGYRESDRGRNDQDGRQVAVLPVHALNIASLTFGRLQRMYALYLVVRFISVR